MKVEEIPPTTPFIRGHLIDTQVEENKVALD
jgi:hypothetical protein